jgi:NodT family efflux transporter outer membrane factor (OMF) lipoprotein
MGSAVLAVALGGCALTAAPSHDAVVAQALPKGTNIPSAWRAPGAGAGAVADDWLAALGDPTLVALVVEALAHNLDLRQAADRVSIAEQSVIVIGAQLEPHVGANVGGRTTRDDEHDSNSNVTVAYADVAWELDVWGKLRAQHAAARAGYEATALDYAYARQSLAAAVAKSWYLTIETRELLALAEKSVGIYRELAQLVQLRRAAGKDSNLDVADTRAKLEAAMSQSEFARQSYDEARRGLDVLLGRYPAAEIDAAAEFPALSPSPSTGMPAELLERRPDIIAAEREVIGAFRQQEAAELALRPDFSLSLVGGRVGDPVLTLLRLNPWFASAALGTAVPIYEGGALRAEVKIATAQQAQAVAHYGSVTLKAFREVENAISNDQLLARRLPLDESQTQDRAEAVRIATVQYVAGRRDLLWVSNLQSNELASDADLIKLRALQHVNRIFLYLALGGSFDAAPAAASR